MSERRYALLDAGNHIFLQISTALPLQENFDHFVELVEKYGSMSLCVGQVCLVELHDLGARLHLNKVKPDAGGCKWQILLPGLPWPGDQTHPVPKPTGAES